MNPSSDKKWDDVKFMKPVIADDPVLMFGFDEEEEDIEEEEEVEEDENGYGVDISRENITDEVLRRQMRSPSAGGGDSVDDGFNVTMTREQFDTMRVKIERMSEELEKKNNELETVIGDMEKMKVVAHSLVMTGIKLKSEIRLGLEEVGLVMKMHQYLSRP